jgi:hypothetical protein
MRQSSLLISIFLLLAHRSQESDGLAGFLAISAILGSRGYLLMSPLLEQSCRCNVDIERDG